MAVLPKLIIILFYPEASNYYLETSIKQVKGLETHVIRQGQFMSQSLQIIN